MDKAYSTDNEYVTNSTTGRPIKVGGRVWRSLRRHGLVESAMDMDDGESAEDSRPTDLEATLDALLNTNEEEEEVCSLEEEGEVCSLEEDDDGIVAYY